MQVPVGLDARAKGHTIRGRFIDFPKLNMELQRGTLEIGDEPALETIIVGFHKLGECRFLCNNVSVSSAMEGHQKHLVVSLF